MIDRKTIANEMCVFCKRIGAFNMRMHHIVPRAKGGKETVPTCGACESFIHATWTHNLLRDRYNTVEKIVTDERYKRFKEWLWKQPLTEHFKSQRNNERTAGRYR